MEVVKVYKVDIEICASASNYWARLAFVDSKGESHEREIVVDRKATPNSNYIQALIDAARVLQRPCMLDIYTSSEYIIEPFKQGWIGNWERNGWKNAKGNTVKNAEQWQQAREALAPHSARFLYTK